VSLPAFLYKPIGFSRKKSVKIISGGQTGVDRAALDAAMDLGLPCGGYCPKGRKAEDGMIPEKYPLQSVSSANYRVRTQKNILEADATLIIFKTLLQGGTRLTVDLCRKHHKPLITIDADAVNLQKAVESLLQFIESNPFCVINVAGPRKSQWPEGYDYAYEAIYTVLKLLPAQGMTRL
jgi:hypothetical protein